MAGPFDLSEAVVRVRKGYLPFVALAGGLVSLLPGLARGAAAPTSASFVAQDFSWHVSGDTAHQATIAIGRFAL